jgi:hypothetical protein
MVRIALPIVVPSGTGCPEGALPVGLGLALGLALAEDDGLGDGVFGMTPC